MDPEEDVGLEDEFAPELDDQIEDQVEDDLQPEYDEPIDPEVGNDLAVDTQQRQPTRGENRVARATREAAEAKRRVEDLERQLAQQVQGRQQQAWQEQQRQLQENLAAMDPGERAEVIARMNGDAMAAHLAQLRFEQADTGDRLAFEALASRLPAAEKLKGQVEAQLQAMRANGTTAPRETIFYYLLGQQAASNAGRATTRARNTATGNRQAQTARPDAGRGDAARSGRQDSASARAKRMETYQL